MSIEVRGIQSISKIKILQENFSNIEGIGKACKEETLHVTMAVLNVEENEEEEMKRKFSILGDMYQDILHSKVGFVITCNGVNFFDHGSVVLPV